MRRKPAKNLEKKKNTKEINENALFKEEKKDVEMWLAGLYF